MRIIMPNHRHLMIGSLLLLAGCSDPLSSFEGVWREYCQEIGTGFMLEREGNTHQFSLIGGSFMFMRGKAEVSSIGEGDDGTVTITAGGRTASLVPVSDSITELRISRKSFQLRRCES